MSIPITDQIRISVQEQRVLSTDTDDAGFLDLAAGIVQNRPGVILLSGGDMDCSRYSLVAFDPVWILSTKGSTITFQTSRGKTSWQAHPLAAVDDIFQRLRPDFALVLPPFSGGAVGYVAYELKNTIEKLPQTAVDDLGLPDIMLFFPGRIMVHDRQERMLQELRLSFEGNPPWQHSKSGALKDDAGAGPLKAGALQSNFTRPAYMDAVARIRSYIREGDVYQVNLSQRFSFDLAGNPFVLFRSLYEVNPAPFYAYVNAGDHKILSTSMERFLLRQGSTIETRPIKGTRKRGASPEEDEQLRHDLVHSPKDAAELSMIVDLLRNDLGRVCKARTIRVDEHKRVERYQNVYHLVSIVRGQLNPGKSYGDLLRATFPGGSITGCPKIRTMEIIDELEPHVRHVYTGSIGYFGWHDNMDLSIAIRTGIYFQGRCHFSVGGGVVYDSDEADEYEETLHKGRTLFELVRSLKQQ